MEERLQGGTLTRLRYFCSPHHQDTPLHPVIRQLEVAAGFARDDTPADRLDKLCRLLSATDSSAEDVALLAALLLLPTGGLPALNLSPQRRKERTFDALIRQVERLSWARPVLMLFEDIHWADPSTREIVDDLIQRLAGFRVLLLMTFRPEFQAPWTGHAGVTLMTLSRLDRRAAKSLAVQLTPRPVLSATLLDRIVVQSDGVPLFIEELTKAVMETAEAEPEAFAIAVPATLQASLMARLDRIPDAKQVAQVGAVIGRDFSHVMIGAIADLPEAMLNSGLDQLVAAELLFRRGKGREATYTFKHALVQDAAYDSLLRTRRVALHGAIGAALERDADIVATRPALLGHHFARAGAVEAAVPFFVRAGEQSAAASAMAEAHAHLTRGLALAAQISDVSDRNLRQAELTLGLGNVQMAVHGLGSPERGTAMTQAVTLCRNLGLEHDRARKLLARALFGDWNYKAHVGQFTLAHTIAEEFLALGRNHADLEIRVVSKAAHGYSCFFLARLREGALSLASAISDYEAEVHVAPLVANFGIHQSAVYGVSSQLLACLGFLGQAREQARTGLDKVRCVQHLPTICSYLSTVCNTAWILRDLPLLRQWSSELVRLSDGQDFRYWRTRGKCYAGWVAAADSRLEEGSALLAEGLTELGSMGLPHPQFQGMLADVRARMGRFDDALTVLDEALRISSRTGAIWADAELYRQIGERLRGDPARAETCFQRALGIARSQSAKLFELRTAVGLAGLWREHGRGNEAQALLAPIYGWFTEGFDMPDLTDARALLDGLAVGGG